MAITFTVLELFGASLVLSQESNSENRSQYFDKPRIHEDAPLYLCAQNPTGMLYALPELPDCTRIDYKETSENVEILLYWTDLQQKVIHGHECYVETIKYYAKRQFWTTYGKWHDEVPTYTKLSSTTCKDMMQTHNYNGENLLSISSGLLGTTNPRDWVEDTWWGLATNTIVNAFIEETRIQMDNRDNSVFTVGVALQKTCYANQSYCETNRGILVWDGEVQQTCRLKVGSKMTCIKTGRRVSCPTISIYLPNLKVEEMCGGLKLYTQGFGGYFSVTKGPEGFTSLIPELPTNQDAWKTIDVVGHLKQHKVPVPRHYFTDYTKLNYVDAVLKFAQNESPRDPSPVMYGEYIWQQQWILDVAIKGAQSDIAEMHDRLCNTNKQTHSLAYYLSTKNPTAAVQTMTGDKSLRATWQGDLLSTWGCEVVTKYKFRPQGNCTLGAPITFVGSDEKFHDAYVQAHSHEISFFPEEVECPGEPFMFKLKENLYLDVKTRQLVTSFHTLPNKGQMRTKTDDVDIAFHPNVAYTFEEVINRGGQVDSQRALNKHLSNVYAAARARNNGQPVPKSAEQDFGIMKSSILENLDTVLYVVCGFVCILMVLVVTLTVYKKELEPFLRPLKNCFRVLIMILKKCFCLCFKRPNVEIDAEANRPSNQILNINVNTPIQHTEMQTRPLPIAPRNDALYPCINNLSEKDK